MAQFFFLGFLGFTIFAITHAIGGLFFAQDIQGLKNVLSIGSLFRAIGLTFYSYLIFYMFRSKMNPMIGVAIVAVISLIAVYLVITAPYEPSPYLENNRSINWGMQPSADFVSYGLYMAILIPLVVIFAKQMKSADYFVKNRAFGFLAIFGSGLMVVFFSYFIHGAIGADMATFVSSLLILIFFFATMKKMPAIDKRLK